MACPTPFYNEADFGDGGCMLLHRLNDHNMVTTLLTRAHSYGRTAVLRLRKYQLLFAVSDGPMDLFRQFFHGGRRCGLDRGSQHRLLSLSAAILGHSAHRQDAQALSQHLLDVSRGFHESGVRYPLGRPTRPVL